jgi:putative nucleotidyltransferase with HDIG domain
VNTRRPPALILKTIAVTFATAALLLAGVFTAITVTVRTQVRERTLEQLNSGQRMVAEIQEHELNDLRRQAAASAERPTLKAAVDTYAAERLSRDPFVHTQLVNTIRAEISRLSDIVDADAVVITDDRGRTLAAAGPQGARFPAGRPAPTTGDGATEGVVRSGDDLFRMVSVPLLLDDGAELGRLILGTALDRGFAEKLSHLAGAETLIVSEGKVIASTLSPEAERAFSTATAALERGGSTRLRGESYAFRELVKFGPTSIYAVASIDAATRPATDQLNKALLFVAIGALSVALLGSIWLAHLVGTPIRKLSTVLDTMAESKVFSTRLPFSGSSLELDQLTATFNDLMASIETAKGETEAAYTAAIRALAAALDARDPYTAGHSERVSTLSVAIGREMALSGPDLEVLRLGALLHDIGKIGVPDEILRKPGALTDDEYDVIKQHPGLGARILKHVPFLAPHLPIVELHHERPDGKGYPYGLKADAIPLAAHIVHVADAYDAMTSARAYRRGRPSATALAELRAGSGGEFHADAVAALATALPALVSSYEDPRLEALSA